MADKGYVIGEEYKRACFDPDFHSQQVLYMLQYEKEDLVSSLNWTGLEWSTINFVYLFHTEYS